MEVRRIGPYRLLSELGRGGMGTVHLAVVEGVVPGVGVGERVALKVLHPDLVRDLDVFERFVSEAAIGRRIRHENVVRTLDAGMDFGDDGDLVYLAMEYVVGRTLAAQRRELGKLPESACRRVAREVARGLQGIHERGVVHGDLKPENILVTRDDVVKVMDLGLARLRGMSMRSTGAGRFEGTFLYAAPEQFSEGTRAIDARADLYALGVSLHELLTGVHPFAHDDVRVVMHRHLQEPPPPLRSAAPDASPFFEAIVLKLLAKDPAHRFRSAAELLAALSRAEDSPWWRRRSVPAAARAAFEGASQDAPEHEVSRIHGFEEELVTVLRTFDEVEGGNPALVIVESAPGGGRTRFVREIATLLSQRETPPEIAFASADAAPALLAAANAPTLVVVDGFERASEQDGAALAAAVRGLARRPVLLIVAVPAAGSFAARNALVAAPGALRILLPSLSGDALQATMDDLLDGGTAGPEVVAWIARWSSGNPRLVAELMADLRESGAIEMGADGAWRAASPLRSRPLPDSLRSLLAGPFESLPAADREFLDAVACAGCMFDVDVVAAVTGEDRGTVAVRLGSLMRQGVVSSDDGVAFAFPSRAHHAVAEGLVQEMLRPEYHRLFADALLARFPAPLAGDVATCVAIHLFAAGAPDDALPHAEASIPHLAAAKRWDDLLDVVEPALAALGAGAPGGAAPADPRRERLTSAAARAYLGLGRADAAERLLRLPEETAKTGTAHTRAARGRAGPAA